MKTTPTKPSIDILDKILDELQFVAWNEGFEGGEGIESPNEKKGVDVIQKAMNTARTQILSHFYLREDVERAIGEHEQFNFTSGTSIQMMAEEAYANGRNSLRDQFWQALNKGNPNDR